MGGFLIENWWKWMSMWMWMAMYVDVEVNVDINECRYHMDWMVTKSIYGKEKMKHNVSICFRSTNKKALLQFKRTK